jgi:hypothetical protein
MFSPQFILGLLIFILFFHILATVNYWYQTYTWLDMPMHFLGGFWVALTYFWLCQKTRITRGSEIMDADQHADQREFRDLSDKISVSSAIMTIIDCLSFVALIGVLWEFFEFGYDVFISSKGYFMTAQQGVGDTMSDLFFDLLGGLLCLVIYKFKLFRHSEAK